MKLAQEMVEEFHKKQGYEVGEKPRIVDFDLLKHRHSLILEELGEYYKAATEGDLVEIADALGDLAYVLLGTAAVHGIDLEPIFHEVHRSNMTKSPLDPVTRKGGKGAGFERPRIAELLFIQMMGLDKAIEEAAQDNTIPFPERFYCGNL